jgi:Surfeit locus protein 5 subunit 22 of Mediator complex
VFVSQPAAFRLSRLSEHWHLLSSSKKKRKKKNELHFLLEKMSNEKATDFVLQHVSKNLVQLLESFNGLLEAADVKVSQDKAAENARDQCSIDVHADLLVCACENLLLMVDQAKRVSILHDHDTRNRIVERQRNLLRECDALSTHAIAAMSRDVDELIQSLEDARNL